MQQQKKEYKWERMYLSVDLRFLHTQVKDQMASEIHGFKFVNKYNSVEDKVKNINCGSKNKELFSLLMCIHFKNNNALIF